MLRDLRYALRTLRRSPGFVVVAVLSLGLGLGLTTTMFGLLDAVRHPYAPLARADALFRVGWRYYVKNVRITPFDMYQNVRDNTTSFDALLPVTSFQEVVLVGSEQRQGYAARVPVRFFDVLGVRPERGRSFTPAEESEDVAVISHTLWKRGFQGRKSLSGLHITIGDRTYSVIGVMPRGMTYPFGAVAWLPLSSAVERTGIGMGFVIPFVRLKPGISRDAASAELAVLAQRLNAMYAEAQNPFKIDLYPVTDDPIKLKDIHFAMLGGAVFVLLIACANLANLMLARGLNARRDLALRLAIGASRLAVVRQMFVECAIVAVAGGAVGAVLSVWGADILSSRIPRELEWVGILEPQLSWRVFAMAALAAALSAVIFGLLPAIRVVSSVSLDEPLKEGSANTTARMRHRYSGLVVVEVALALALMMGAGLLAKVVHHLTTMDYAFPARKIVKAWAFADMDTAHMQNPELARAELARRRADVITRIGSLPGVVGAALEADALNNPGGAISAERTTDSVPQFNTLGFPVVTSGYVLAMGFQVVQGRDFLQGDESGPGVAILNETAAHVLYPHGSALGHMVKLGSAPSRAPWVPVVGIVHTGPMRVQLTNEWVDQPRIFVARGYPSDPKTQFVNRTVTLIARTEREDPTFPNVLERTLRSAGWSVFGGGVSQYLANEQSEIRTRGFLARLFAIMATFALGLAAVGLYGVLAYAVTRRMREFGVRVAVGAQKQDILRLIAHDSTVMVLAGTAVGGFLALGTSFILEAYLIGVYPTDAWTLVISETVLFAAAAIASVNPALRAMRANPLEILRAI
jgi:putative ABC transport system permease protein